MGVLGGILGLSLCWVVCWYGGGLVCVRVSIWVMLPVGETRLYIWVRMLCVHNFLWDWWDGARQGAIVELCHTNSMIGGVVLWWNVVYPCEWLCVLLLPNVL